MVQNPRPIRLMGLSAVLAAIVAVELTAGPFLVPEPSGTLPSLETTEVAETISAVTKPAISEFDEVVERPLFARSRRPPTPASEPVKATQPETYDLVGIILAPKGRVALLRKKRSDDVVRGLEGQEVGGWKIREIKTSEVVLERGDFSELLKINDTRRKAAATTRTSRTTKKTDPQKNVAASKKQANETDSVER
jgi:hypothetical protein